MCSLQKMKGRGGEGSSLRSRGRSWRHTQGTGRKVPTGAGCAWGIRQMQKDDSVHLPQPLGSLLFGLQLGVGF